MAGRSHVAARPTVSLLYEDAALIVVDKPPGVTVVPAPDASPGTCLRDQVTTALGTRVWVVHRLDRDTSGVVVLARSPEAHRALSMAFEARLVIKHYRALVAGAPDPRRGCVETPLHEARRGKARPARAGESGARPASTAYVVGNVWRSPSSSALVASVDVTPTTGRHHQIRVHLRSLGTPILGDALYGRGVATGAAVPRLALHAGMIDLPHPTTAGRRVVVESPWPADLSAVTRWLDVQWTVVP